MTYTDEQLKRSLAKMLPCHVSIMRGYLRWNEGEQIRVLDTELLHLCWMVETSLSEDDHHLFRVALRGSLSNTIKDKMIYYSPSWQQRTVAAAKVKGVEIV